MEKLSSQTLQWGAAAAPLPGQTESGDRFLVKPFQDGALVAVVDALGHGHRAAQTAERAVDTLAQYAQDTVTGLVVRCHATLRRAYGATMSLASFDWRSQQMTWLGIGNVAGVLIPHWIESGNPVRRLLVRGGVVGGDLPELDPVCVPFAPGDTLVVATDGIQEQFADTMADTLPYTLPPQQLAEHILKRYAKSTDDALVLVARYCVTADEREH